MLISDIPKHRLINQQLINTKFSTPTEVVSWFGAVQGQEYAFAKWAIGLRLPDLIDEDIEQAIENGEILRTHLLRPTWHFVAPQDIRWMLKLTAPRVKMINAHIYKKSELNNDIFKLTQNLIVKTLEGGKYLTRTELKAIFEENNILTDTLRLSSIMMESELDGLICSGKRKGKQFTYALLDERVPKYKDIDREEALILLLKKYFQSHNPATLKDFSTWSGLTLTDAKKGMELIKSDFVIEKINEENYYFSNSAKTPEITNSFILLPIYDEYVIGYKNRDAITNLIAKTKSNPEVVFDNVIVVNGQIIGTWKRTVNKKSIDLKLNFFQEKDKKYLNNLEDSINHFSKFMNLPVNVQ